jgi:hypothetical protein
MTKKPSDHLPPLEGGLLQAMRALDNQIARAMERTPAEREVSGVQKWTPYAERVELVSTFLLESFGDEEVKLDSVLILAQAFPKVLAILSDELGREALGKVRSAYVEAVLENLEREMGRAVRSIKGGETGLM